MWLLSLSLLNVAGQAFLYSLSMCVQVGQSYQFGEKVILIGVPELHLEVGPHLYESLKFKLESTPSFWHFFVYNSTEKTCGVKNKVHFTYN